MGSSNRQPYLTTSVLDQAFLDDAHTNLENRIELTADIEAPGGATIHVSDRNKYVVNGGSGTFYQARTIFPVIKRTLGEWLSTEVEFSTLALAVSNVDGAYNKWLAAGASYAGWILKRVTASLGIAEMGSTYKTIFDGRITDVGGVARNNTTVTFTARDRYDVANIMFPPSVFTLANYPQIGDDLIGVVVPVIYGDWTNLFGPNPAAVTTTVVNGASFLVNNMQTLQITIATGSPGILTTQSPHKLAANTPVQLTTDGTLPSPFSTGTTYYAVNVTQFQFELANAPFGSPINCSGGGSGTHNVIADPTFAKDNVTNVISDNALLSLDQNNIYLKRGTVYFHVPTSEITNVAGGNKAFDVMQQTLTNWVDGGPFIYADGDGFVVRVIGKDLGAYTGNAVSQAKDILINYATGISGGDFDANWNTYRDKASPAQSAIANIPSRVWIQEQQPVIQYVQSILDQVRLELFISNTLKIKINSLHFEDWVASPGFTVKNWDVVKDSFNPQLDVRNNFNRAQGSYNFLPDKNGESQQTEFFNNPASIAQSGTKPISKILIYPNLYTDQDVKNQLIETLRLASSIFEVVEAQLTWRAMLQDLGDFVRVDVKIGGVQFDNVPCMIREVGYDPQGMKIPVKLWSFQLVPFPGYTPGFSGTVGGYAATIVQET